MTSRSRGRKYAESRLSSEELRVRSGRKTKWNSSIKGSRASRTVPQKKMDDDVLTTLKLLIIGESGVGKSRFVCGRSAGVLWMLTFLLRKFAACCPAAVRFCSMVDGRTLCDNRVFVCLFTLLLQLSHLSTLERHRCCVVVRQLSAAFCPASRIYLHFCLPFQSPPEVHRRHVWSRAGSNNRSKTYCTDNTKICCFIHLFIFLLTHQVWISK